MHESHNSDYADGSLGIEIETLQWVLAQIIITLKKDNHAAG
jgi:hypothetical protein